MRRCGVGQVALLPFRRQRSASDELMQIKRKPVLAANTANLFRAVVDVGQSAFFPIKRNTTAHKNWPTPPGPSLINNYSLSNIFHATGPRLSNLHTSAGS
ncbi:hypothetical protein Nepgr_006197 [Nepenthes gracilis]|uniref:Uncharacterized protein n=1 Tax=Nepenthes gracilis TaxID=150966 RepID=A0AAD3S4N7_NEPGR|nr:hypothetical protein Nepgr_006197 [Nepenthes gracilis]